MNFIKSYFGIDGKNTTIRKEVIAGLTTFLTMAYIIFVNPNILSTTGMDKGAVFVATCLAAATGCFIMGFVAKLPVALAPGMGLNAFFTYSVVLGMGYTWQTALGAVFLSGCVFLLLGVFKVRKWIINAIPRGLKQGIVAGIGAFLAFIAMQNSGIIVDNPAVLVGLGPFTFSSSMALLGFLLITALSHFRVTGAVTIGVISIAIISLLAGYTHYSGVIAMPPSIMPTLLQLDIAGAFNVGMISVVFAFLFVDLFDTSGTLIAVAKQSELMNEEGEIKNLDKALLADATATITGALYGTSSTTSYIESNAGVAAGGRTGLVAVVVGILFLLSLFFAPLAGMIPAYATAGAILYVSVLMLESLTDLDWKDIREFAPAVVCTITMPLTYSIADGITIGFISYTALQVLTGRYKEINAVVWVLTAILLLKITGLLDMLFATLNVM
ncbi:NCS2 family permease [Phocoenobacter skyensis]|uniref:Putative MFS transporter, AGZA family, xanthine/uracil permease n=1 Tax=Phocoenobacter skyensis TaxID=97481 RepID=A0A1H7ZRT8_9PAST|nr:NCS2 family permease [Pasteurella skyensis]MDP8186024.1 NCS2 family permease [Pasteurella skyensis]QLB23120.1 guanine permease [Pasteurella skyensis]SEM60986.1 putative MFS transporter, AGZA family, xanthine/uracil permease [Pasteurella skyensis]